jgi:hypothetical protein
MEIGFSLSPEHCSDSQIGIDWKNINLGNAKVKAGPNTKIDAHSSEDKLKETMGFLDNTMKQVLPWVNRRRPANVSNFKIPTHFVSLDISNLKMSIHDDFVSMSMDPVFNLG